MNQHPHPQASQEPAAQPPPAGSPPSQPGFAQPQDFSQPVAYDVHGRPLYLHPPAAGSSHDAPNAGPQAPQPQMVYMARPLSPQEAHIPAEVQARHEASKKKYPSLNLSAGEYVISAVRRHPIGLARIWIVVAILAITSTAMVAMFLATGSSAGMSMDGVSSMVIAGLVLLYAILTLGGLAATYVYENNRFYLTNESVIQEIQTSLFDKREQTVSLSNIEDASYSQGSFIQSMFNYGSIRLSTEGDETTYRFEYVAQPKQHLATLNNAVESFKNGRPVE
jgi:hypothetical protein